MKRVVKLPIPANPEIQTVAELAAWIKAIRTQSGLTLEEAALLCGISRTTLNAIELGRAGTSIEIILQVAKNLGLSLFAAPGESRAQIRQMLSEANRGA